MINYHDRIFLPVSNSENGAVDASVRFHYHQNGNIVTCSYQGSHIRAGQLIALVADDGSLDMRYHQVSQLGELMSGTCRSIPEIMPSGKIRLRESWQWTSGDCSAGHSVLEEL